jgi:hypothetical protein
MSNYIDFNRHKSILGVLFVVFSSLNIVFALFASFLFEVFLPTFVDEPDALLVFRLINSAVWVIAIVLTAPGLVCGIGLLKHKDWALTLAFVLGIIALPAFPVWTFVGIYAIVIFLLSQRESNRTPAA